MGILQRIADFLEAADPLILVGGLTALMLIIVLGVFQKRLALFFLLALSLTLDAASIPALGMAAALARFAMIFVMATYVVGLRQSPGKAWWMFVAYVVVGLLFTARSSNPLLSIQWGGLTLASALAAASLVEYVNSVDRATKICLVFVLCAVFWSGLGLLSLMNLGVSSQAGARFAGFTQSAGIFVQTGGMLLPFAVWGALRPWNQFFRVLCALTAVLMVLVLLASAQRTGTFAGLIACLPLLARAKLQKLLVGAIVVAAAVLVVYKAAQLNQAQTDFATKRLTSKSTSQRTRLWASTIPILMEEPFLGRGFGINKELHQVVGDTVHNTYLQIWYDTGILGLIFFVVSGLLAGWQGFLLIVRARSPDVNELARLMFGILLSSAATGFFATGAASPSDFATMGFLFAMVLTARLAYVSRLAPNASARVAHPQPAFGYVLAPIHAPAFDSRYSYWFWPKSLPQDEPPANA